MSEQFEFDCNGHNSIYEKDYLNNNYNTRKFKVYFSTPSSGVNSETGILLFIAGFGGNTQSNIYTKMRQNFADLYNLVTIQCDYFGSEYMQSNYPLNLTQESLDLLNEHNLIFKENKQINYEKLKTLNKKINLTTIANLSESLDNFNDMSYMQAIDNITAILNVLTILYNNNYSFNTNKIIIMGHSQGAYLSYLCNNMCRGLFTHILDNSAWIYPSYLQNFRILNSKPNDNVSFSIIFSYLSKQLNLNLEHLKLGNLYKNINNECSIVSYNGVNDEFTKLEDKITVLNNIDNSVTNIISDINLKEGIFTNTNHGLGADFNKLFDSFYKHYVSNIIPSSMLNFENTVILNGSNLEIDYSTGLPTVTKFDNLF